jgi:hypothetical protein
MATLVTATHLAALFLFRHGRLEPRIPIGGVGGGPQVLGNRRSKMTLMRWWVSRDVSRKCQTLFRTASTSVVSILLSGSLCSGRQITSTMRSSLAFEARCFRPLFMVSFHAVANGPNRAVPSALRASSRWSFGSIPLASRRRASTALSLASMNVTSLAAPNPMDCLMPSRWYLNSQRRPPESATIK